MRENLHTMLLGEELDMPLILMAGYNSFSKANYLGWHKHRGFELTFALKGSVRWEIENHATQHMTSGSVSLVLPHVAHRGTDDVTHPCEMAYIVFNPQHKDASLLTPLSDADLQDLTHSFSKAGNRLVKGNLFIDSLLHEFVHSLFLFDPDKRSMPMIRGLLCQLILHSAMCFRSNEELTLTNEIKTALAYINEHYMEEIGIKDIADYINKSETYLYNTFKKELGQPPNEYILGLRLEKACESLKSSTKSITEISLDAGFTSTQYFSKMFSRFTGRTPSSYRTNPNIDDRINMKYYPE